MTFVLPMAGLGTRFKNAGYDNPKMLIEVHGKTLLEWSVDSLPLDVCKHLIFICLKVHDIEYGLTKFIKKKYENNVEKISFIYLDEVTNGQAETVLKAKEIIDMSTGLLIFNIDTYFESDSLKEALLKDGIDGVIGGFESNEDRFSFAKIGSDGHVVKTAEKDAISDTALTGLYHFKRASDFVNVAQRHIDNNITTQDEFYIAPMYNELISMGKKYIVDFVKDHWILGTPSELENFRDKYKD